MTALLALVLVICAPSLLWVQLLRIRLRAGRPIDVSSFHGKIATAWEERFGKSLELKMTALTSRAGKPAPVPVLPEQPYQLEARLEAAFSSLRAGESSIDDYKALLDRELDRVSDRMADLRISRSILGNDLFALEMEDAQMMLEAVQWRRIWAHGEIARRVVP